MPDSVPDPAANPPGSTPETAVPREAARVLLLDAEDRVLLIRAEWDGQSRWFTPGGGLEPGETPEEAAHRELREETGLDWHDLRWEGECWLRDWTWFHEATGRWLASHEHFYLARFPGVGGELPHDKKSHTEEELVALFEDRWWPLDALRAEAPATSPRALADLLPALLEGGCPPAPVAIGR